MAETAALRLEPGTRVKNRWEVVKKISQGTCSAIYEMRPLDGPGTVALKAEAPKGTLEVEFAVLKELRRQTLAWHAARLLACGANASYNFMVMDFVGPNLSELRFARPNNKFTPATTIRIGIQCLEAVRDLHNVGYLHRDVKPRNFARGASDTTERIIYMLDFSQARKFIDIDSHGNKHIREPRQREFFRGTVRYCSYNVHLRLEQGRHDDLCSWLYMMVELLHGLPWRYLRTRDRVADMKRTISTQMLLEQCPDEFEAISAHIESLSYRDEPKYDLILAQLWKTMKRNGCKDEDPYDWQEARAATPSMSSDDNMNIISEEDVSE